MNNHYKIISIHGASFQSIGRDGKGRFKNEAFYEKRANFFGQFILNGRTNDHLWR